MSEQPISREMNFEKQGGRSTRIQIVEESFLARGEFGEAFIAKISIGRHTRSAVIKKFADCEYAFKPDGAANAATAIENYNKAKKAGLKVFPTYRLGDDGRSILMTNATHNNAICLSNETSIRDYGLLKLDPQSPDEYLELINGVLSEAKFAQSQGIHLPPDAYFFLFDTEKQATDYVIGDMDMIRSLANANMSNLEAAYIALCGFFEQNFNRPEQLVELLKCDLSLSEVINLN